MIGETPDPKERAEDFIDRLEQDGIDLPVESIIGFLIELIEETEYDTLINQHETAKRHEMP